MYDIVDSFTPHPDRAGRHEITIKAPAALVWDVARNFDINSIPMIRGIFWLRGKILGAKKATTRRSSGLVDDMFELGWGRLAEKPGYYFVAGAACQPWQADVVFTPIAPDRFANYDLPDHVKIAWTLEVEAIGPVLTRFATETRVVATDNEARIKFCRYWRLFGIGIVMIRRLMLPAVRREAERKWAKSRDASRVSVTPTRSPRERIAS